MTYHDVPFARRLLFWVVSGVVLFGLMGGAKLLGYLDDPANFKTAMAVIFAIWLATAIPLFVLITGVGRHPK